MDFVRNVLHILVEGCTSSEKMDCLENTLEFPKYFVCFSRGSWKIGYKKLKLDKKEKNTDHQFSALKTNECFVYFKV